MNTQRSIAAHRHPDDPPARAKIHARSTRALRFAVILTASWLCLLAAPSPPPAQGSDMAAPPVTPETSTPAAPVPEAPAGYVFTSPDSPWPTYQHDFQRTGRSTFRGPITAPVIQWQSDFPFQMTDFGIVVGPEQTLVARHNWGTTIFDRYGRELRTLFPGGQCGNVPTYAADGNLYFGDDLTWYGYNRIGDIHWSVGDAYGCRHSALAVDRNGWTYIWNSAGLMAISAWNGNLQWQIQSSAGVFALGRDGSLYHTNNSSYFPALHALNPDGTAKWSKECCSWSSPSIGADGTIYTVYNSNLTAYDQNGNVLWEYPLPGSLVAPYASPAIGSDGTLYIGTMPSAGEATGATRETTNGALYAINPDGTLKWRFEVTIPGGMDSISMPAIVDNQDNIFFGTTRNRWYGLDRFGHVLWQITVPTGGSIIGPAIPRDGVLYIATSLAAYALAEPGLDAEAAPAAQAAGTPATDASLPGARPAKPSGRSYDAGLQLLGNEDELASVVLDAQHGFAYFGTNTSPGKVVKVRLADMASVGTLTLNPGEDFLHSAVLDPVEGFAYFGANTYPGRVVKVRLSDFTRAGTLTLPLDEHYLASAMIDTAGRYAYFGTDTQPGRLVKIDLSTFTRVAGLTLNAGEDSVRSAVIDPAAGYGYLGLGTAPALVAKVALSDLTRVGSLQIPSGQRFTAAVIDAANGYAYFGTDNGPGRIMRVRLSDFSNAGVLTLPEGELYLRGGTIDPVEGMAYFALRTTPGRLLKVRLADFTRYDAVILTTGENLPHSLAIDVAGDAVYTGLYMRPGKVVKVRMSDFTRQGALGLEPGQNWLRSALVDSAEGFAYFGTSWSYPGQVVKLRLSDFSQVAALPLSASEPRLHAAVLDAAHGYAYFAAATRPSQVIKVRLADFAKVETLLLADGDNQIGSGVIDAQAGFAYFGTDTVPGRIIKVDLATFTRASALTLGTGLNRLNAAVADPAHGYAYFATTTSPGQIVKIRLSDFSLVGTLTLQPGEDSLLSAAIDAAGGYAYFGTATVPGRVIKVRLADLTRVGAVVLAPGDDVLVSAVLHPGGEVVYFGTETSPGRVVQIRTQDLAEVGSTTLGPGENSPSAAAVDPVRGYAYFGTSTFPGLVARLTLGSDLIIAGYGTPNPVTTGSLLTYTLTVSNASPQAAQGVVLTDTLPATVSFDNASPGCTYAAGVVTCVLGDLPGDTDTAVFIRVVAGATSGLLINSATVQSNRTDPVPANNTVRVVTCVGSVCWLELPFVSGP